MYAVIYVIGVFHPKQIKTCAIACRPFEILCQATANLTCTRKLFLYNLLCMTHHFIFVNSVRENFKSGVDFAPGRHFRSADQLLLEQPTHKLKLIGLRALSVCAPYLWNSLPFEIKSSASVSIFKLSLRHIFFDKHLFRLSIFSFFDF